MNHLKCVVTHIVYTHLKGCCVRHTILLSINEKTKNNNSTIASQQEGRGFDPHLHQAFLC